MKTTNQYIHHSTAGGGEENRLAGRLDMLIQRLAHLEQQEQAKLDEMSSALLGEAIAGGSKRANRKVLRMRAVEEITGKKKSSIYAAIKAGTFPAPISLGGRASGWVSTDIDDWLEQRIMTSHQTGK